MLVRDVRSRQRGPMICAALAAFAFGAARPQSLLAQQQAGAAPASHTVKRGDTLWDIAKLYLGDPFLWPDIYRLNTDVVAGSALDLSWRSARSSVRPRRSSP